MTTDSVAGDDALGEGHLVPELIAVRCCLECEPATQIPTNLPLVPTDGHDLASSSCCAHGAARV